MFTPTVNQEFGNGPIRDLMGGREVRWDPGMLRPWLTSKGEPVVTLNTGRFERDDTSPSGVREIRETYRIGDLAMKGIFCPVANAASMYKEGWIALDKLVLPAARFRQRLVTDLENLRTYTVDGMAKETLEYQAMSDPGEAIIDMDGLTQGRTDNPLLSLRSLPLPITHVDWTLSKRRLEISKASGQGFDDVMAEASGTRIGESFEKQAIGTDTGVEFGTVTTGPTAHTGLSKVYGLTTHPYRITKTNLTTPTTTNGSTVQAEVLGMINTMMGNKFYGPYILYHSTDWSNFLDLPFSVSGGNANMATTRDMLKKIPDLQDVRRLDFLFSASNPYTLVLAQAQPTTMQMVVGMGITTVVYPSKGGMQFNYKTMGIKVPRFLYDYNGVLAVLHATTS